MGSKYDEILNEIKNEHALCIAQFKKFSVSAKTRIKELAEELRKESTDGIKLSNEDIRDRILKDCLSYWKKWTIVNAFPDWLKGEYNESNQLLVSVDNDGMDMVLPNEDEKYNSEEIRDVTLQIKRAFGVLLNSVTNKEEVTEIYNDYSYMEHTIKNIAERITATGREHKAVLKNPIDHTQKQLRKPISVYDLNFQTDDPDIQKCIETINDDMRLIQKQIDDYLNGVNRYQIFSLDQARKMMHSGRSLLVLIFNGVNSKSSQSIYQQLETDLLAQETTEKHAGREARTKTVVCAKCIKKFDAEKNDIPPVMKIDNKSPTGMRCPNCLETEVCERGLTQDIVTQRKEFLKKVSDHLSMYPPLEFIEVYSESVKEPITGTKKVLMSEMLKKSSSFGSTKEQFE